ncbi:MAG: 4-vinyl reductase [Clostridiales bacterium]|nr:4-vinyl reductase [Clostridiales bacterium]
MANLFKNSLSINEFTWGNLGDIKEGREDLGEEMPVIVYRLMQFTLLDVLTKDFGSERANDFFRRAGFLAGTEFARNTLDLSLDFSGFLAALSKSLSDNKIGILRMEAIDPDTGNLVLTVGQDLDCSGLPIMNETVCNYDEGFISGILNTYTGRDYDVREIDCWATGDRVCRFSANVE